MMRRILVHAAPVLVCTLMVIVVFVVPLTLARAGSALSAGAYSISLFLLLVWVRHAVRREERAEQMEELMREELMREGR